MRIKRKVMPGQPGTHKLVKQYGDALICVRYRYDTARKRRLKTVELIIEETPWEKDAQRIPPNKIVALKVDYHEKHLQKIIKSAGGKWIDQNSDGSCLMERQNNSVCLTAL